MFIEVNTPRVEGALGRPAHVMPFGAKLIGHGVNFRLWAPHCTQVLLAIEGESAPRPMDRTSEGWFSLDVAGAGPGTRYAFELADGTRVPDPASRYQPADVHGPSEVIDPAAYCWKTAEWRGSPWETAVLYEFHVGAFTPEGTFRAAIGKLDRLAALGITALEIMPVAEFPGRWNWGYDGVLLYAPDSVYGRPDDFKAFIDEAHARGIMVLLDVVYNHFGPAGNYMPFYAPVLTEKHQTPWGSAVNFDDERAETVRAFAINNALYWLEEYRLDGLRLDSICHIEDEHPKHMLAELAERAQQAAGDRHIHLIVENPRNIASWLKRDLAGKPIHYTAQWSDDIHNTLHAIVNSETHGYYADYGRDLSKLGRALAEGFAYQGDVVPSSGVPNGEPSADLPPTAFVAYLQNHDQVGNRPSGDRLATLVSEQALWAVTAIQLLSPSIPLVFMGEEWGATQPFPYFSDVDPALAESIREGRHSEFREWFEKAGMGGSELPDPMDEKTFLSAKLRWPAASDANSNTMLTLYRRLLAIRRDEIVPRLVDIRGNAGCFEITDQLLTVRWRLGDGAILTLLACLEAEASDAVALPAGRKLWNEGFDSQGTSPWAVAFFLDDQPASGK